MEIFQEKNDFELCCRRGNFVISPGRFHWHEKIEICQIISNDLKIHVDEELIHAHTGDIVAIEEYAIHSFVVEKEDVIVRLCQFPVKILLNSGVLIKPLKTHITAEELSGDPDLSNEINSLFDLMEKERRSCRTYQNPFFQQLSAALYFAIMRKHSRDDSKITSKKDRREFYKIAEYINDNYTNDITVNSISKELCFSRGKLSEIFGKFAGTGINTYINTLRINHVNQLIENGISITDAAFEAGFQSMRTFNNAYQKIMNMTPSEYIKRK